EDGPQPGPGSGGQLVAGEPGDCGPDLGRPALVGVDLVGGDGHASASRVKERACSTRHTRRVNRSYHRSRPAFWARRCSACRPKARTSAAVAQYETVSPSASEPRAESMPRNPGWVAARSSIRAAISAYPSSGRLFRTDAKITA